MNYRRCNACGLSNLATESFCYRCGAALAQDAGPQGAPTLFATDPTPAIETRPIAQVSCPSCGSRITAGSASCQYCGGSLLPAKSADFYQARLVPDSGFRRAQEVDESEDTGVRNSKVTVFAVFNIVFALLSGAGAAFWLLMVFNAILGNDQQAKDAIGGFIMFLIPHVVYFCVFLPAAIGLIKRTNWGYYCHLAGAILAGFSCIGLLYTVPALMFAFQPDFKRDFPNR